MAEWSQPGSAGSRVSAQTDRSQTTRRTVVRRAFLNLNPADMSGSGAALFPATKRNKYATPD